MNHFLTCKELRSWAKDECIRQSATRKIDIDRMVRATLFCYSQKRRLLTWDELIEALGKKIDPEKNKGFRCQPVTIAGKVIPVIDFKRSMENLGFAAAYKSITPEEWYQEFETIHPFNDGNGRVGAIIYNYLLGSESNAMLVPPPYIKNPQ